MTFGNLSERTDLRPLFGPLSVERHELLLDRLLAVDVRITQLADQATRHVGVPYKALRLDHGLRADGSSSGIHGGPSGDAGDIWFDISPVSEAGAVQWCVKSSVIVFCTDSPEGRDFANTHYLLDMEEVATTPEGVLDLLEAHISIIEGDLQRHPRERFTSTRHAELP